MTAWALIVNPVHRDSALRAAQVAAVLEGAGIGFSVQQTTVIHDGAKQAAEAVGDGASRIIVIGGDGTVRAVAAGLHGLCGARGQHGQHGQDSGAVPLLVIPVGTANLFAHNLGLAAGPVDAARLLSPVTRGIDLGRVRLRTSRGAAIEDVFLIAAGMGEDARTVMALSPRLKRLGGWLAYPVAGIPRLGSRGGQVRVAWSASADSGGGSAAGMFNGSAWSTLVGNAGRVPAGIRVFPGAHPTSGDLELLICTARSPLDWLQVGLRGAGLLHSDPAGLTYHRVTTVTVEPESPTPVHLDGEVIPGIVRMEVSLLPRVLSVVG